MLLIGYDIGSSSVKASLVDSTTKKVLLNAQYPEREMSMISHQEGWAEQHPQDWWSNLKKVTDKLFESSEIDRKEVKAIGIAYQMHGLVVLDEQGEVVRPSIIWCDSRAVSIGEDALEAIGKENCLASMLNSPGNFTASKLKWVKENEPANFDKIKNVLLPGDFIAYKFTGKLHTTISGLSEGIFWDFQKEKINSTLLDYYGIGDQLLPPIVPTFSNQGKVKAEIANEFGFSTDAIVSYRAGDQPNNAFTLNAINPGEIAATAGTSGVVYGIVDQLAYDRESRVNTFAHVNHSANIQRRLGVLLCINGTGSAYSWLRNQLAAESSYPDLEIKASKVPAGADGVLFFPFGNGAERMLGNQQIGAQFQNLQFNRHGFSHLVRACLEGIAFSFVYGINCMKASGVVPNIIKTGNDNLFQSLIFSQTIADLAEVEIQVKEVSGSVGAALGAGLGANEFKTIEEAFSSEEIIKTYYPSTQKESKKAEAYYNWQKTLNTLIKP